MFYTYILRSIPCQNQRYIGSTSDLRERIKVHNPGEGPHTRIAPLSDAGLRNSAETHFVPDPQLHRCGENGPAGDFQRQER